MIRFNEFIAANPVSVNFLRDIGMGNPGMFILSRYERGQRILIEIISLNV